MNCRDEDSILTDISRELVYPDVKQKVLGGAFPKDKRFLSESSGHSLTSDLDYQPNYDTKYRKAPCAVIKKDENREELRKKRKARFQSLLPSLITSEKVNFSVLTADTECAVPGPGSYNPQFAGVEITRNVGLSKASRFEASKKDDSGPLAVVYTQVEANKTGPRLRPPAMATSKLVKKRIAEKQAEETRAQAEIAAMKEKELREKNKIAREAKIERPKTEKERVLELFRLVEYFKVA